MSQEATKAVCATCGRIAEDESVVRFTWARGLEEGAGELDLRPLLSRAPAQH
jgi:hypothetical protein